MIRNRALRSTLAIAAAWIGVRAATLMSTPNGEAISDARQLPRSPELKTVLTPQALPAATYAKAKMLAKRQVLAKIRSPQKLSTHSQPLLLRRKESAYNFEALREPIVPQMEIDTFPSESRAGNALDPPEAFPTQIYDAEMRVAISANPRLARSIHGSSWTLLRKAGNGASLATNGQLGASQAGMRIYVPVDRLSKIALHARISGAVGTPRQVEAAIGVLVDFPRRIPAKLLIERRISIADGGRNAFVITGVAGFYDKPLAGQLQVSGYVQAGLVGLNHRDGFVDTAARVESPVRLGGAERFKLGAGIWAAAQPGVSRIDIGPRLSRSIRLGTINTGVSLEWRQRVAGAAAPQSGIALSLGADF